MTTVMRNMVFWAPWGKLQQRATMAPFGYVLWMLVLLLGGGAFEVKAATDCNAVTEIPVAECQDLLTLYNSTNGPNWVNKTGWNVTNTPCSWYGVSCGGGHVINLLLKDNKLSGLLPNFTNLPNLNWLDLQVNQLSGPIPDFSNLPKLTVLALYSNQLNGSIPNFSNLPKLTGLYLGVNQLSGPIPDFSNLPSLTGLYLANNQLSGPIPDFSNLPNLTEFNLQFNQLNGPIPNFSNLPNLTMLPLYSNKLSGPIPDFSNLPNLTELYLGVNQLSGPIPDFSNLPNLTVLALNGNQLSGPIPNFSNLPNLTELYLHNNQLNGTIPNLNWSGFINGLGLSSNCGLVAYDVAQEAILNSKDPNWQTRNPSCPVVADALELTFTPTAILTDSPMGTTPLDITLTGSCSGTPSWTATTNKGGYITDLLVTPESGSSSGTVIVSYRKSNNISEPGNAKVTITATCNTATTTKSVYIQ